MSPAKGKALCWFLLFDAMETCAPSSPQGVVAESLESGPSPSLALCLCSRDQKAVARLELRSPAYFAMARPTLLPAVAVLAGLLLRGQPADAPRLQPRARARERRDSDVPFNAGAASGAGASVEFKKRPFGILRYQPGEGMKGAMAMEIIPKSRYPGDPQGQAFASGVQSGWVVQSINGMNVQNEDFGKIMDMLDDEVADPRFSKSTALALEKQGGRMAEPVEAPLSVVFSSIPGYVYKGAQLTEDGQDGFAR
ncbi:unnamed protein product [Symbiodinium sp. CCMP2592]|nr:unnamed protein product [Symbiodinium sp. CCMP2592]